MNTLISKPGMAWVLRQNKSSAHALELIKVTKDTQHKGICKDANSSNTVTSEIAGVGCFGS